MINLINIQNYKSILCLNGEMPPTTFFNEINLPIYAADGAANYLIEHNIIPKLIIGDLDSLKPDRLKNFPHLSISDQNKGDFEKALQYLQHRDLLPAIIVGISGGFLDHILNNINIFMQSGCLLYAPPIIGFVLNANNKKDLLLPFETKISIMGMPEAVISSVGLKWELYKTNLSFPGISSCFNRSLSKNITLETHQGSALILIYNKKIMDAGCDNQH